MAVTCPTCNQRFDPAQSVAMPFCSVRCQQIDLGKWLNEEFTLPVDPERDEVEEEFDSDHPDAEWN